MLDPGDYRDVLVISRERSLKGAAAQLGVDPSTMTRRLDAIEDRLGAKLFLRAKRGLEPTPDAAGVIRAAEAMEQAQLTFERELLTSRPGLANGLTLTAAEWSIPVLTPILCDLANSHREVPLRLRVDNRVLDLARREADVAIRVGRPTEEALTGRRLGSVAYGLFGSAAYLHKHGAPRSKAELGRHSFCSLDETLAQTPAMRWQRGLAGEAPVLFRTSSMLALVEAARAGCGLATLPLVLADRHPDLKRVLPDQNVVVRDVWLVFHRDLRGSRSLRPVLEALTRRVKPLFSQRT
jgi:DNA-binding transcriptional LysR family regulator